MLRAVLTFAGDRLKRFLCVTPDNPRALPAGLLAEHAENILQQLIQVGIRRYNDSDTVIIFDRHEQAVQAALTIADPELDLVCAFGSLYLAGSMRRLLGGHP